MLRALEPDDLDFLYALENDPELWAVSDVLPAPVSRHALGEYLRHAGGASLAQAGQLRLVLVADDDGRAVGTLDLYDYNARHRRAGVGIAVLATERRRGHARAALLALLPYARQALHLHQLYCTIAQDNHASIKLFGGVGFAQVGVRREWLRTNTEGRWENAVEMQLVLEK